MGLTILTVSKNSYQGTYNFEFIATKNDVMLTKSFFKEKAECFLTKYCINNTSTEQKMLKIRMRLYRSQIEETWAA